jgi:hypothetical protein
MPRTGQETHPTRDDDIAIVRRQPRPRTIRESSGEGAARVRPMAIRSQQQQTGMSFIIRQQVQPHFIMLLMHSQHD